MDIHTEEREHMKYAFVNGYILDGNKGMHPVSDMAVLVDGEKIVGILSDDHVPRAYKKIDLQGAYLLPGLIDLHVHLATNGKPPKSSSKPTDYTKLFKLLTGNPLIRAVSRGIVAGYARTELMSGVTTIRTVGGALDMDAVIRDIIAGGKLIGPRIIAANTAISVPGGHFAGSIATEAVSPEMAVEHVRQIAATNPDLIKLMITGGVVDAEKEGEPGVLHMPPEIVKAACDEAHRLGYKVAAHVESTEGIRVALENGVDSIEHGAKLTDDLIRLFRERGAVHICTLSPFVPYVEFELEESHFVPMAKSNGRLVLDGVIECTKKCMENDIPVGLGSDTGCPFIVHYNFWRELVYFHRYIGGPRSEALYRATLGNARAVGIDGETGSIETGKCADLIVVKDNPLEDLSALRNVSMVMARGRLIRNPTFKRMKEVDEVLDRYM